MASLKRFGSAVASAKEHAPGRDYHYVKKAMQPGQNKYRVTSDIVQVWCHWVKDREGKPKPIFCYGPDPNSPLYQNDDGTPTGQGVCLVCQATARMALSKDPAVVKAAEDMAARPTYAANVIDLDTPEFHAQTKHTKLLVSNEDSNFFGQGMAGDIYQALVNYGSADEPADYRTFNGKGLIFITTKTGTGKQTRYPTTAMEARAPLTPEEQQYAEYDLLGEIAAQTPMKKVEEWLGKGFFAQWGVTPEQIAHANQYIKERERKRDADEGTTPGESAPTAPPPTGAKAPVSQPAAPPSTASAPAAPPPPSEPSGPPPPAEPSAPPPPANPAQQVIAGPDGAPLPPGVRWKGSGSGKPYFWHVSNVQKVAWTPAEVAVPS